MGTGILVYLYWFIIHGDTSIFYEFLRIYSVVWDFAITDL